MQHVSHYPSLLLIVTLRVTSGERKFGKKHKKVTLCYVHDFGNDSKLMGIT